MQESINNEEVELMPKVKPGDVLSCEVCGLSVIIDEDCGYAMAEIICCDEIMENKGPKPAKKAAPAPKKKAEAKKAKPAATKKPAPKKEAPPKTAKKKASGK
jgi:hypothetical protein